MDTPTWRAGLQKSPKHDIQFGNPSAFSMGLQAARIPVVQLKERTQQQSHSHSSIPEMTATHALPLKPKHPELIVNSRGK